MYGIYILFYNCSEHIIYSVKYKLIVDYGYCSSLDDCKQLLTNASMFVYTAIMHNFNDFSCLIK